MLKSKKQFSSLLWYCVFNIILSILKFELLWTYKHKFLFFVVTYINSYLFFIHATKISNLICINFITYYMVPHLLLNLMNPRDNYIKFIFTEISSSVLSLSLFLWRTHTFLVLVGWFLWDMTDFLPLKFIYCNDVTAIVVGRHFIFIIKCIFV